jgi:hypothetical protein
MDYLLIKLFWYLVVAFVIGLIVGWVSCGRAEE